MFDAADEVQADIVQRQEYDARAVVRLNEAFYQAFTKQDTKVMAELWLREPEVSCIHPGVAEVVVSLLVCQEISRCYQWRIDDTCSTLEQVGYDRVMRVWKDILAPKRSWIRINPEDCQVVVRGNTAFAYCFERVVADAGVSPPSLRSRHWRTASLND